MPIIFSGPTSPSRSLRVPARRQNIQFVPETHGGSFNHPVIEDGDQLDWIGLDGSGRPEKSVLEVTRKQAVAKVRWLAKFQPNVKQALRLYNSYVLGRAFDITLVLKDKSKEPTDKEEKVVREASNLWNEFLKDHKGKWSIKEFGRRVWRDGEQFTRTFDSPEFPPQVRFVDPEHIDKLAGQDNTDETKSFGIVTEDSDIVTPISYTIVDGQGNRIESVPAEEMFHSKIDVDTNEKRGLTRFLAVINPAKLYNQMMGNEVEMRNLQSSIVIHRKVKGSPSQVTSQLDTLKTSVSKYPEGSVNREKIRRGTILTTNQSVEIEFKQPNTNFSDASPLVKQLVLQISAATGWPYFMISTDSADSNFASSLVQESPVALMVADEQDYFKSELLPIFEHVMLAAISAKKLKLTENQFKELYETEFRFPQTVERDKLKDAQTDNIYAMGGAISKKELTRRAGANVDKMKREIEEEQEEAIKALEETMKVQAANAPVGNDIGGGKPSLANSAGQNQGGSQSKSQGDDETSKQRRSSQGGK